MRIPWQGDARLRFDHPSERVRAGLPCDSITTNRRSAGGGAGNDWFYHILQTPDGGYLASGFTYSFGQGGEDIYLVKTDANGNSTCQQTNVYSVKRTTKTTVANASMWQITPSYLQLSAHPAGYTGASPTDVCSSIGITTVKDKALSLHLFPNPNNGSFTISFDDMNEEKVNLTVQNILGETIYVAKTVTNKEINLQHLVNGTYFVCMQTADKNYTQKIIIAK